jgi:hypothetical protein
MNAPRESRMSAVPSAAGRAECEEPEGLHGRFER